MMGTTAARRSRYSSEVRGTKRTFFLHFSNDLLHRLRPCATSEEVDKHELSMYTSKPEGRTVCMISLLSHGMSKRGAHFPGQLCSWNGSARTRTDGTTRHHGARQKQRPFLELVHVYLGDCERGWRGLCAVLCVKGAAFNICSPPLLISSRHGISSHAWPHHRVRWGASCLT